MLGIIGKKLGTTNIFEGDGTVTGVTAIEAGPCFVTQVKTEEQDGYAAVQLGFGEVRRLSSPEGGHLKKSGKLLKYLREFRGDEPGSFTVGQKIDVGIYKLGDRVDVIGTSKGKGFAGGVKRHHFRGGPKTHGQSDRHRAPGSVGGTTFPGRVWKGQRMAGHMGDARVTVRHLEVVRADSASNLLLVKGAVPGAMGSLLLIEKSRKVK